MGYTVRDGLVAKDVRKYDGHARQALTEALLTAFMRNKSDIAPAFPRTRSVTSKQLASTAYNLGHLCQVLPDFAGYLAEYLWDELATECTRDEKVSREDIGWI